MKQLRSAEDVAQQLWGYSGNRTAIINADRDAVRQECAERFVAEVEAVGGIGMDTTRFQLAILGKVDEKRERLGRVLWEAYPKFAGPWDALLESIKEDVRKGAEAVRDEIAKMREEE